MWWLLCRATVDALSRRLRGEGLSAAAYHAALPAATRELVLQQWRAGQLQVVVASVAFGMGVDKGGLRQPLDGIVQQIEDSVQPGTPVLLGVRIPLNVYMINTHPCVNDKLLVG
jgi:hypothetical protein